MVKQIVERFEKKGYSDDNEDDREYIVERMQRVSSAALMRARDYANNISQMQAAGSPPPDLVGDMSAAQEALGELEGGCPTQ
jgi:peroxin-19